MLIFRENDNYNRHSGSAFSRLIPILNLILSSMSIIKNAKKSVV